MLACKEHTKRENELDSKTHSTILSPDNPLLEVGCYEYHRNGNDIYFKIIEVNDTVRGDLNIAYAEKDANKGTFMGKLNGNKLIGTYTFNSEGLESSREVAFLVKEHQLIEGYGEMDETGTKFKDINAIEFNSNMPLIKTDCI